ncbi:MAG: hypothetical protein MUE46_12660 [Xanthomonadales bacterium]|nr:hypothetical protein [Xanthomonadales bacterium]
MRKLQNSMPVLVLLGAALCIAGWTWVEQRADASANAAGTLRLLDAAADAATDAPADAYMPGLFK